MHRYPPFFALAPNHFGPRLLYSTRSGEPIRNQSRIAERRSNYRSSHLLVSFHALSSCYRTKRNTQTICLNHIRQTPDPPIRCHRIWHKYQLLKCFKTRRYQQMVFQRPVPSSYTRSSARRFSGGCALWSSY